MTKRLERERRYLPLLTLVGLVLLSSPLVIAQTPELLDVSDVVVGSQRLETRYALAEGKWSDASKDASILSTEIHCYKRFSFCEVAEAIPTAGRASVALNGFDILRWDNREMIAVDSSPKCVVVTLRFDFTEKKVSLSSASKGDSDQMCKGMGFRAAQAVFLTGRDDELKRINAEATEAKRKK
jgi:hypothetical protein